ncbi:DNA mismatch repair protein MutS [Thermus sp. FJN-A]
MEQREALSPTLLGHEIPSPGDVPGYFRDLLLSQLERDIFAAHPGMGLEALFRTPLPAKGGVVHRQQVARELEKEGLGRAFRGYFRAMEAVRAWLGLGEKARHPWQARLHFLQAAGVYLEAVTALDKELRRHFPRSLGLGSYRAYLEAYRQGPAFRRFQEDLEATRSVLLALRYTLQIREGRLLLRAYRGEADYGERVQETFRPFFGEGTPTWEPSSPPPGPWLNHVEEWILDHLALLFPGAFGRLEAFSRQHQGFVDPVLARLEWEARFFLAYLDFIAPLWEAGLPFTYPEVAETPPFFLEEGADLALAAKAVAQGTLPVPNGFRFDGTRVLVVTGPNQGGKTTFARMVGQAHHLAALGLPVPGKRARLPLPDRILTHFEVRENPEELKSKLEEDLLRLKNAMDQATERSLLLLNEPFASAPLEDARLLGHFILKRILARGSLAVVVTFLDELARLPGTRSLVAEVDPLDPARRTFRIRERPPDGKAYALALAEKHGLTYALLKARLGGGG